MLTLKRWPSDRTRTLPLRHALKARGAFTLIELLVVVAIIALLLSILLPSLRSAREQAKAVACGGAMRGFGSGMAIYTTEGRDWFPGMNTTGVSLEALRFEANSNPAALNRADLPVQTTDWLSPILNTASQLPYNRAERFQFLLGEYRCPSMRWNSIPYELSEAPDLDEFNAIESWAGVSYLMPSAFQYWGRNLEGTVLGRVSGSSMFSANVTARITPDFFGVQADSFVSRIDRVGSPASKVFVADGTRFLSESLLLDHDVSTSVSFHGAFGSAGAWFRGSEAYGVRSDAGNWCGAVNGQFAPDSNGEGMNLSYRHTSASNRSGSAQGNKGSIEMLFFDGHVERRQDKASRDINVWYPKGAIVNNPGEGMTCVPAGYKVRN